MLKAEQFEILIFGNGTGRKLLATKHEGRSPP